MKRTFASLFAVVLLAAPFAASALSTSDIQSRLQALLAQLAALQAQIVALQAQVPQPATTCPQMMPPECPNGTVGSRGTDSRGCSLGYECKPASSKCGVNSYRVQNACSADGSYSGAWVQCYDGYAITLGEATSCKPASVWETMAKEVCAKRCAPTTSTSTSLTVNAWLSDPTGQGREAFDFGTQLVINWSVAPVSDLETNGWGIYPDSLTGIELRPADSRSAAGIRIVRTKETGVYPYVYTWDVTREGLYGDIVTPGRYYVYVNVASKSQGGYRTGIAGPITIGTTPVAASTSITVTAPNGGEQWELDTMNTVTWTPYQYNPDVNPSRDVTAFLERKNPDGSFATVGKIQESGKASIHWYAGELNALDGPAAKATAGEYYVRVVNNMTGATDRSDKPFSLVTKSVDLKVNGQDGPAFDGKFIYVTTASPLKVTWQVKNGTQCNLSGVAEAPGQTSQPLIPVTGAIGSKTVYPILVPAQGVFPGGILNQVSLTCKNSAGAYASDYVQIDLSQPAAASSVRVTSPNGGEVLDPTQTASIRWEAIGVERVSVALYKNEKWTAWIAKDLHTMDACDPKGVCAYSWSPGSLGARPDGDQAYKIYVTGKKIDGTGSVDDKSDAPFSFANTAATVPGSETVPPVLSGNRLPVSDLDIVGTKGGKPYLSGWAYDPDAPSSALSIRIQKNGTDVGTATTDINAPVVNAQHRITGAHRFRFVLPDNNLAEYHVYAIDANTQEAVELSGSPRTLGKGQNCVLGGVTVRHGLSRVFYSADEAVAPAKCASYTQRRTCSDSIFDGDEVFQYATCRNVKVSGETSSAAPLEQLAATLHAILGILGRTQ